MAKAKVLVREGHGRDTAALSDQSLALPGQWEKNERISNGAGFLIPVGTHFVDRDVLHISEKINKWFPNLRVASCTCGRCVEKGHFPHVVIELGRDGRTYPVFGFRSFGPHVLERIKQSHISRNPEKRSLENNERIRKARRQASEDARAEANEIIEAALKSQKFDWKGPKGLKTDPARTRL